MHIYLVILLLMIPRFIHAAEIFYVWGGADNAIVVQGEILEGDADALETLIVDLKGEYEPDFRIAFDSPGGDLIEGLKMGLVIRNHKLGRSIGNIDPELGIEKSRSRKNGYIGNVRELEDSICASACAYAFLGGVSRYMVNDYKLGFHQFYMDGETINQFGKPDLNEALSNAQEVMGAIVFYFTYLGDIEYELLLEAIAAKPDEMNWLSIKEARNYHAILYDHYHDFYLEPYKNGMVAVSRVKDSNSGYDTGVEDRIAQATFFCRGNKPVLMLSSDLLTNDYDWDFEIEANWSWTLQSGDGETHVSIAQARAFNGRVYMDIDADMFHKKLPELTSFLVWLRVGRARGNFSFEKNITPFEVSLIESTNRFCIS